MDSAAQALHLYPSALARDAALDALPAAAWTDRHLTFSEFAVELDRLLPPLPGQTDLRGAKALAGPARCALLLRALGHNSFRDDRERFGSDAALKATAALLAGWKGAGLAPKDVTAAAKRLPSACEARDTVQFLARLYAESERLAASSGPALWADREAREQYLLERLDRAGALPAQLLPQGAPLDVHGFHRLVRFQRCVLERIVALGHAVRLYVPFDAAREGVADLLRTFGSLRASAIVPKSEPPRQHVRIEAATPYAEVYEIGRRIRRWITEDNVPPSAIALAFRDLGAYSQLVSDVFTRFRIPFYERRGEPAAFQPVVRVALSGIEACVNGLPREDLFRFLCSGVVDLSALAGRRDETVDAGALRTLALDARIDRFFDDEARHPAQAWAERLERYAREAKDADTKAAAVLRDVVKRLDELSRERTARQHAAEWKKLCRGALCQIALHRDRLALAELEQALDAVADAPFADGPRITLEEFQRLLKLELAEHSVRAEGSARGGVRVLNLYDLRGLRFEKLVIGAMVEGSFPAAQTPHALLGRGSEETLRRALAANGHAADVLYVEPRLTAECLEEERALFAIACAAAAGGTLVFTRPCVNADGRPAEPSAFWHARGEKPEAERAAAIYPAPPLDQCLTAEEVELRAAWVLGGGIRQPAAEERLAAACFTRVPRVQKLARLAAIERGRQEFFASQGTAAAVTEEDQDTSSPNAESELETPQSPAAGPYNGMVADTAPEAAATLAQMVLVEAAAERACGNPPGLPQPQSRRIVAQRASCPLSPSALEALAACPFSFLVEKLWRFKEAGEPEEELSQLDKGSLWHTVLAAFYREQLDAAHKAGRLVACLDAGQKAAYRERLRAIAGQVIADAPRKMFVGPPGLWNLQREQIEASLAGWLDHEMFLCRNKETAFRPAEVEFSFGARPFNQSPPVNVPIAAPGQPARVLPLEGRLDRLDLLLDDTDSEQPLVTAVRVIDYKLGRCAYHKDDVKEEALSALLAAQLPVYLKAALEFVAALETQKRVRVDWDQVWLQSQAGYYCLRDIPSLLRQEKDALVTIKSWPATGLRAFLSGDGAIAAGSLFDAVRAKVLEVLQGHFPVCPPECRSTSCAARFVCRYQAVPAESDAGDGVRKRGAP